MKNTQQKKKLLAKIASQQKIQKQHSDDKLFQDNYITLQKVKYRFLNAVSTRASNSTYLKYQPQKSSPLSKMLNAQSMNEQKAIQSPQNTQEEIRENQQPSKLRISVNKRKTLEQVITKSPLTKAQKIIQASILALLCGKKQLINKRKNERKISIKSNSQSLNYLTVQHSTHPEQRPIKNSHSSYIDPQDPQDGKLKKSNENQFNIKSLKSNIQKIQFQKEMDQKVRELQFQINDEFPRISNTKRLSQVMGYNAMIRNGIYETTGKYKKIYRQNLIQEEQEENDSSLASIIETKLDQIYTQSLNKNNFKYKDQLENESIRLFYKKAGFN